MPVEASGRSGKAIDKLERLIDSFNEGVILREGVLAVICGKPVPIMFRTALAGLAADLGRPVRARDVAMVGDDPVQDIAGARRVGLRGILVLTGKTDAAAAALGNAAPSGVGARRSRAIPDAVAPSLADVVAALD